jgi:hypothetical protein
MYPLVTICLLLAACNNRSIEYDTVAVAMIDQTDRRNVEPTAKSLLAPFKLQEDAWQGLEIKLVAITDKDINRTVTVSLPRQDRLTGNTTIRRAKVAHFIEQMRQALISFHNVHSMPRSVIFRAIAKRATELKHEQAKHTLLLVYSDLMEHSNVSFYNQRSFALLETNPLSVERQLVDRPFTDLSGVNVWLLYAPKTYEENNLYMAAAHFYEHIYTAHHALVHIENQLILP